MGERDRRDDGDEQQHRGDLQRIEIAGVDVDAEQLRVAELDGGGRGLRRIDEAEPGQQDGRHLERDDDADDRRDGKVAPEAGAQRADVDVEHHDDEQEQHHHRADVDEDERDRQELGAQQHPDAGRAEEREHQEERGVDRAPRRDDAKRRHQEDGREDVEERGVGVHVRGARQRYFASASFAAAISFS